MLICDFYVLSKRRSSFFYMAFDEDVITFTLSRRYVWGELFNDKNEDYLKQWLSYSKLKYKTTIFSKISHERKMHIK